MSSVVSVEGLLTAKGASLNVEATGPWDMNVCPDFFESMRTANAFFFWKICSRNDRRKMDQEEIYGVYVST
jgi:hypothetical protein